MTSTSPTVGIASNGAESPEKINSSSIGTRCELMTVTHSYDKNGQSISYSKVGHCEDEVDENLSYALIVQRFFNAKRQLVRTQVDINSRHLLRVFSEIVKYYPAHPERFSEVLVVDSPYMILYHHWQQLKDYRDNTEDDMTRMHIKFLLDFMDYEMGNDSKKADRLKEAGSISFPLLWTIFRPGELMIQRVEQDSEHHRLWRFVRMSYKEDPKRGLYLEVTLTGSDYDGIDVGRHNDDIQIYEQDIGNPCAITSLEVYPLTFVKNPDQVIEKMRIRGQKFLDFRGIHIGRYEGPLQRLRSPPWNYYSGNPLDYEGLFIPYNIQGRIVIDTKTFMEESPYTKYDTSLYDCLRHDEEENLDNITQQSTHTTKSWKNVDPILFPAFVHGFYPGGKLWCRFYIDQISEPQWKPERFQDLILPASPKRVIWSLVRSHLYPKDGARDQQESKGKGLVVLLHGSPGTGKTLTAESVAEVTKRVLVVISSGELGTEVEDIDRNLTKYLQYTTIWGAIVLIDEADVFLEERLSGASADRLKQNSLVAVFLRQLEYYQGIVFLTTNRSTGLDPAIKSRIHLFIRFFPPDFKTQETLWRLRLGNMDPDNCDFDLEKALEIVGRANMNGREISNAVNTISTLAREEGKKISIKHFQTFMQVLESFEPGAQGGKEKIGKGESGMQRPYQKTPYSTMSLILLIAVIGVVCTRSIAKLK